MNKWNYEQFSLEIRGWTISVRKILIFISQHLKSAHPSALKRQEEEKRNKLNIVKPL